MKIETHGPGCAAVNLFKSLALKVSIADPFPVKREEKPDALPTQVAEHVAPAERNEYGGSRIAAAAGRSVKMSLDMASQTHKTRLKKPRECAHPHTRAQPLAL
jgi:hypothetical protein